MSSISRILKHAAAVLLAVSGWGAFAANVELLNVSYDPTRELYQDFNKAFAKDYAAKTRDKVTSGNRTAARASRHARSSTASRPTW